jgi:[ribosomal protein S18]-alanine N-acetyltransferase
VGRSLCGSSCLTRYFVGLLGSPSPHYNRDVSFSLREFQPGDFESLFELDQKCFPPGIAYSRRELARYMKMSGAFTLIAEAAAKRGARRKMNELPAVAGFIVAQRHPRGMGHVVTIDTAAEFRRSGVGTLLMNAAEEKLIAGGCDAVFLETAVDNAAAIKFYKRLGYFVVKTLPRYYQNQVDAFLMAKRLDKKQVADAVR